MTTRSNIASDPAPRKAVQLPWRALGFGSCVVGPPLMSYLHPELAAIIAGCEFCAAITVIVTALYGSATTSDRAFRFLRWLSNQPEPDAPPRNQPQGNVQLHHGGGSLAQKDASRCRRGRRGGDDQRHDEDLRV
jgi:hypothetical protein